MRLGENGCDGIVRRVFLYNGQRGSACPATIFWVGAPAPLLVFGVIYSLSILLFFSDLQGLRRYRCFWSVSGLFLDLVRELFVGQNGGGCVDVIGFERLRRWAVFVVLPVEQFGLTGGFFNLLAQGIGY